MSVDGSAGEWIQAKQTKKKAPTARRRVDNVIQDKLAEDSDDVPYRPPNWHKPDKVVNDDSPRPQIAEFEIVTKTDKVAPIAEPESTVPQAFTETERVIEKVTDNSEKINDWSELSDRLKSGHFKPIIKETVPLPTVGYVVDRRMSYSDAIIDLNQMIPVFVSKDPRWWLANRPPKPPTPDLFDDYFNSWQFRNNVNLSCEQRIEKYSDDEYDADIEYDQDQMFDDTEITDIEVSTKVVD